MAGKKRVYRAIQREARRQYSALKITAGQHSDRVFGQVVKLKQGLTRDYRLDRRVLELLSPLPDPFRAFQRLGE